MIIYTLNLLINARNWEKWKLGCVKGFKVQDTMFQRAQKYFYAMPGSYTNFYANILLITKSITGMPRNRLNFVLYSIVDWIILGKFLNIWTRLY